MPEQDQPRGPIVGVGAVVVRGDQVLLVRRGAEPRRGCWSVPGGKVLWGERLEEAVVRETREETGVLVTPREVIEVLDLMETSATGEDYHFVIVDYRCDYVTGQARAASDADAVAWVARGALADYDLPGSMLAVATGGFRRASQKESA